MVSFCLKGANKTQNYILLNITVVPLATPKTSKTLIIVAHNDGMTRTRIYEVGDTLIPVHVVMKWSDTYGYVLKKRSKLIIFLYNLPERNYGIISTHTWIFCMTNYSANLINLWPSYRRHMNAAATYTYEYWHFQHWMQKHTDLRTQDFEHCRLVTSA